MEYRQWTYAYRFICLPEKMTPFINDELFGCEETNPWHKSRGRKRWFRLDPRWEWLNYYELLALFVTDDAAIAVRFQRLAHKVEDRPNVKE